MGGTAGASRSTLTLQIKVKFNGIDNVAVDNCAGEAIPARITCKAWEEANMVVLANNDKRDGGAETQFFARVCGEVGIEIYERYKWRDHTSDEGELVLDNRGKLSFRDTA